MLNQPVDTVIQQSLRVESTDKSLGDVYGESQYTRSQTGSGLNASVGRSQGTKPSKGRQTDQVLCIVIHERFALHEALNTYTPVYTMHAVEGTTYAGR